jgi:imidazoleglycerol-phosphate dehydratase
MAESTANIRQSSVTRKTKETDITCRLTIDGSGRANVNTGIGFFDHMLVSFAKHGLFDLDLTAKGDLIVDCHHTIEDVGIVLGEAIKKAVGDKRSIRRYGDIILPMDEALIMCAVDLSGRPYLVFDGHFTGERVGYFDTQMVREFFYAVSYSAAMNLHIRQISGENDHHIIEGMFKAFAKALDEATLTDSRITSVLSTKGSL